MVADLISVEEAYGVDPATGEIDMDKFRRFAAQQEASLANMRANTQLSEPLQTLQANPELLYQAVDSVASQGVAPGADFQAMVEDYAVQNPTIQEPVVQPTVQASEINPQMLSFANILANTYDLPDPSTEGEVSPQFTTGANTLSDFANFTRSIDNKLYNRLTDAQYGDTNEDKAPGRVGEVFQYMFSPNSDGDTGFEFYGGTPELIKSYMQLGITGEGDSYADKQARDMLELAKKYSIENLSPSIDMDGTGGADGISLGGPTGTGYDSVQQAIADMPNALQQLSAVPSVNPLALLNTLYNIYTGNIMKNPYDTSDATGTPKDRSVPSPMEFNAPTQEQLFQQMDQLQMNSPGYPKLAGGQGLGAFGGVALGGDGSGYGGV